jgi:hypothetical protein
MGLLFLVLFLASGDHNETQNMSYFSVGAISFKEENHETSTDIS